MPPEPTPLRSTSQGDDDLMHRPAATAAVIDPATTRPPRAPREAAAPIRIMEDAAAAVAGLDALDTPTTTTRPWWRRVLSTALPPFAALLVFVTVVLVLFVLFNTQTVDISLVFGDVQAPLVLALLIAAALGGLVVALAGLALRARRRD